MSTSVCVAVLWGDRQPRGRIEVQHGTLVHLRATLGEADLQGDGFAFSSAGPCRLEAEIDPGPSDPGGRACIVTVRADDAPFSFFLRDVDPSYPILIPGLGVAVTAANDLRSYAQIRDGVTARGLSTVLQRIAQEPETSFDDAARRTRRMRCPTWLGLSRDMRVFEIGFREEAELWDWVQPRFHAVRVSLPEGADAPVRYQFMLGRGIGCSENVTQSLEDGVLPILHARVEDADVVYETTCFVILERTPLGGELSTMEAPFGTHYLVADGHAAGHMFTQAQQAQYDTLVEGELAREEETVLCFRAEATNTAPVPRYAWLKAPFPSAHGCTYAYEDGLGTFSSGRVYGIARLNGRPLAQEEVAVLLRPRESATLEFCLPHRPISSERAATLLTLDFDQRLDGCRTFWRKKLEAAAHVHLPERRIEEMVQAGLLHLDLIAYGREPDGTLAPCIGVYAPIGSESAPIAQFLDSMGWHDVARRALTYFLDKQHEDGFIQNFGGYMLETGAALWSLGEHYRYTRDLGWVKQIRLKLLKSCQYLLQWRERNKRPELAGQGYGMIDGKCADPEDPYHTFMLNGYAYLGLSRVAEMLGDLDPAESRRWAEEAEALRRDIRASFAENVARSPVVPLGDGTWCPTAAPWPGYRGPTSLYAEGGKWFSHGTTFARDSLLGPLYLAFQEVLDPGEPKAGWLLNVHAELMTHHNVAFSQPYYSRHPYVHLRRGEVKAFLKAYYHMAASLADRETYTFWEHYFHASPHKTHEEGWFLMQTRWMLYLEQGDALHLLPGIPRAWLVDGQRIELDRVATYFGPVSFRVQSILAEGRIEAAVHCASDRQPARVRIRLPHPDGRRPREVRGGSYDAANEVVEVEGFCREARVELEF
jgi:hypothetical protein